MEVILLHIFTVISFVACQAEETFLEDRIGLVPECKTKTDELMAVTDSGKAILIPAIGA